MGGDVERRVLCRGGKVPDAALGAERTQALPLLIDREDMWPTGTQTSEGQGLEQPDPRTQGPWGFTGDPRWKEKVEGICSLGNRREVVSRIRKRETTQLKTGKEYEQGICRKGNQSGNKLTGQC